MQKTKHKMKNVCLLALGSVSFHPMKLLGFSYYSVYKVCCFGLFCLVFLAVESSVDKSELL